MFSSGAEMATYGERGGSGRCNRDSACASRETIALASLKVRAEHAGFPSDQPRDHQEEGEGKGRIGLDEVPR